jgi:hypothetical protein
MTYVMVRCVERTDEGVFLVALERLGTLSTVLGKVEIVGEIQGCCDLNCSSTLFSLVCL